MTIRMKHLAFALALLPAAPVMAEGPSAGKGVPAYNPVTDAFWKQIYNGAKDGAQLSNFKFHHETADGNSVKMIANISAAIKNKPAAIIMAFNDALLAFPGILLALGLLQLADAQPLRAELRAWSHAHAPWHVDAPALRGLLGASDRLTLLPSWYCAPAETLGQAQERGAHGSIEPLP